MSYKYLGSFIQALASIGLIVIAVHTILELRTVIDKTRSLETNMHIMEQAVQEHIRLHNSHHDFLEASYNCWVSCEGDIEEIGSHKICKCRQCRWPHTYKGTK